MTEHGYEPASLGSSPEFLITIPHWLFASHYCGAVVFSLSRFRTWQSCRNVIGSQVTTELNNKKRMGGVMTSLGSMFKLWIANQNSQDQEKKLRNKKLRTKLSVRARNKSFHNRTASSTVPLSICAKAERRHGVLVLHRSMAVSSSSS